MSRRQWLLLWLLVWLGGPAQAEPIRFGRDIRPILSNRCWRCHGPDRQQREADLRLDQRDAALADRGPGAAIVPGDPAGSLLIQRVAAADDDERMPPADHGPRLSAQEIERLRQWIAEGAAFEGHWAFEPITRPAVPPIAAGEVAHTPIDAFVLARLRAVGLAASPEADRHTLLRRVSLDLLGLPPTPGEIDAFVRDDRAEAYALVVERLLASPHYGERWGRHWLDQARYADSNGYTIDAERVIWPYRDWVIRALNADLPFDRFTVEQLAGDLLPGATTEQRIATGFHRNTLINQEGGTDPEQFRIEAVMDRVATTGAVWLGLTVGCAQCHSHKYDPISQEEYYRLLAFFNHGADVNNAGPTAEVHEGELFLPATADPSRQELAEASAQVERLAAERGARRTAWEQQLAHRATRGEPAAPVVWNTLVLRSTQAQTATLKVLDDQSVLATPGVPREIYEIEAAPLAPGARVGSFRLRFLPHASLPKNGPGLATNGNLVLTAVEIYLGGERLPIVAASADHAQKNFPAASLIDDDPGTGWAINTEPGSAVQMNAEHSVVLTLGRAVDCGGRPLRFVLKHELNNDYNVGRVQFATCDEVVDTLSDQPFVTALMLPVEQRTTEQNQLIEQKFDAADMPLREARQRLDTVRRRLGLGPTVKTLVMQELPEPRATYLFLRGDFLRPDKERGLLSANVPAAFPPLPPRADGRPFDRLDLARWLVSKEHPLTARVTVNRVWMRYFGRGLVETENDFGSQGSPPSHPELLDWLAGQWMDSGWSLKALHRTIVMSATYRQASHVAEPNAAVDPLNVWLSRQNRIRLDAEIIRDAALAASGLLSHKLGGPSVFPPQPDGVYAFTQNKKVWTTSTGADRYRRGIYTMFYRSAPYPTLSTFDTPDFQSVCTRRQRSNTPLQALTLANDAALFELTEALAQCARDQFPVADAEGIARRVELIFLRALGRRPADAELELLANYAVRRASGGHTSRRGDARDAGQSNQAGGATPSGATPSNRNADDADTWTAIARAVMNTDEFVTRE